MSEAPGADPTRPRVLDAAELRVPRVEREVRRLLVRLPNWLGDIVMAAPAVAAIARALPGAYVTAQVKGAFQPLAARIEGVDAVVPAGADRGPGTLWQSRRFLRASGFDGAVLFPRSTRAALAPWLARIPVRVGYGGGLRRPLFTHGATGWRPLRKAHRTQWFGVLAKAWGVEAELPWGFRAPPDDLARADALLATEGRTSDRPLVVLEPGASYGAAKCWPAPHFAALAAGLSEAGCEVATVGLPDSQAVEAEMAKAGDPPFLRLAGKTPDLGALFGVLARADLVVSNDTGPMHVAAALGVPTLALFGASDPGVSAPGGAGPREVHYQPAPCSPCFRRTCPVPGHPCLAEIQPAHVLTRALGLLKR